MRKVHLFGSIGLVALNLGGAALAADLPVKTSYVPPASIAYSWTGLYLGAHVGYATSTNEWRIVDVVATPASLPGEGGITGALGGAQVGLNYQFGGVVLGIEADFSWPGISGRTCTIVPVTGRFDCSTKIQWFGTATARVGVVAFDRALLYIKGGAAWVKNEHLLQFNPTFPPNEGTLTTTQSGATGGAGIEYAVSRNWSAKLEYDFLLFGEARNLFTISNLVPPNITADVTQRIHVIKFGINYKFDWGSPVVVN